METKKKTLLRVGPLVFIDRLRPISLDSIPWLGRCYAKECTTTRLRIDDHAVSRVVSLNWYGAEFQKMGIVR